uniref:Cytochrome P450 n=1 Tax=Brachionus rotundiformis TaxID=96890 RepID=A0A5J6KEV4_9BILA|nr:cytochrome P450 [Brachionus rotundiformis]
MNLIILGLFLILVCSFVVIKYHKLRREQSLMPPMVPGRRFFGNYYDLAKEPIHLSLTRLGQDYTHAFTIQVFGHVMVVLNSRQSITEMLNSKTIELAARPTCLLIQLATNNAKDLVFSRPNLQWLQLRTAFHKFFSDMKKLHDRKDITEIVFRDEWCNILPKLEANSNKKSPYEIKNLIYEAQSKIMSVILFGEEVAEEALLIEQIRKLDTMSKNVIANLYYVMMNMKPLESIFDNSGLSLLCQALKLQKNLLGQILLKATSQTRTSSSSAESDNICLRSLVDLMISLLNLDKPMFTQDQIKNVLTELIFAGIDGIVVSVNAFILYMCLHKDVQQRVFEELSECVQGDFVQLSDKKSVNLTNACIHETLRLVSQIPLGIFRKTVTKSNVCGYEVPADTVVIPNLWKLHHDESVYQDAFKFNPDRFMENGVFRVDECMHLYAFGAGKRACPGKNVAINLIFLFVSNLVKNFEFELVDSVDEDPRSFILSSQVEPPNYRVRSAFRSTQSQTSLVQTTAKKSEIKTLCTDRSSFIKSIQDTEPHLTDDEF